MELLISPNRPLISPDAVGYFTHSHWLFHLMHSLMLVAMEQAPVVTAMYWVQK
jgi:hypothetical protein